MRSRISDDFEEEKMLVNKKFSKEDIKKSMLLYGVTDRQIGISLLKEQAAVL